MNDPRDIQLPPSLGRREYQIDALCGVVDSWKAGHSAVLVVAPTGAGKTSVAGLVTKFSLEELDRKVLFIAHRDELIEQATNTFVRAFGFLTAVEKASQNERDFVARHGKTPEVVVATVQSLYSERLAGCFQPDRFGVIICDEAHRACGASYKAVLEHFPDAYVLGITATPDGATGQLGALFEKIAFQVKARELVDDGYLVPVLHRRIQVPVDLRDIRTTAGDYNVGDLAERLSPAIETLCFQVHSNIGDRQTVIFTPDVGSAQMVALMLQQMGRKAEYVAGEGGNYGISRKLRKERLARFKTLETQVIVCCDLLVEGYDCLDSETEILTPSGWSKKGEIEEGDIVYSLNKTTGLLEETPVDTVVERHVSPGEKMAIVKSQHLDIRVTEGHEFHIKYVDPKTNQLSQNFLVRSGREMADRKSWYGLPLSAHRATSFPGLPLSDDEIRLIAWFMTDGGFESTYLAISQSKDYWVEIKALLERLGLDYIENVRTQSLGSYPNARDCHRFFVPKGNTGGSHARRGWCPYAKYLDKRVADSLNEMTREQFKLFWEEMLKGDGSIPRGKSGWLWCCEKSQADAYTHMAVIRGFSASYKSVKTRAGKTVYRVSVRDAQWIKSCPTDPRSTKITLEDPSPEETVWCVRNRNSTIVTRRNGKIAIIGNCPAISCVVIARPTKKRYRYCQMVGRGTRPCPEIGKTNELVLDLDWQQDDSSRDLCRSHTLYHGEFSQDVLDVFSDRIRQHGGSVDNLDILGELREIERDLHHSRIINVKYTGKHKEVYRHVDATPFGIGKILDIRISKSKDFNPWACGAASPWQVKRLASLGVAGAEKMNLYGASRLISKLEQREKKGLASHQQVKRMLEAGVGEDRARNASKKEAAAIIAKEVLKQRRLF